MHSWRARGGRVGPCARPGRAGGCAGAPGARLPHVVHVEVAAGRLRSTARVTAPVLPPVPTGQRSGTDEAGRPHARRGRPAGPAVAARARCARPHTRAGELTHAEPAGAAVGRARLDRPDHGLLAHQQGQVAQRAEVELHVRMRTLQMGKNCARGARPQRPPQPCRRCWRLGGRRRARRVDGDAQGLADEALGRAEVGVQAVLLGGVGEPVADRDADQVDGRVGAAAAVVGQDGGADRGHVVAPVALHPRSRRQGRARTLRAARLQAGRMRPAQQPARAPGPPGGCTRLPARHRQGRRADAPAGARRLRSACTLPPRRARAPRR